jgi:hypothetical protein
MSLLFDLLFGSSVAEEETVLLEDGHVRDWLEKHGFEDLRSEKTMMVGSLLLQGRKLTPLAWGVHKNQLNVCKWLYDHGAAPDITKKVSLTGIFTEDEVNEISLMFVACEKGNLSICKWLFEMGAAEDITKVDRIGRTPMFIACAKRHLSVCKWLYEVGAAEDLNKTYNEGQTLMHMACVFENLSVCQWLLEVSAAANITKADDDGNTPMSLACAARSKLSATWLVFNGALDLPTPEEKTSALEFVSSRLTNDFKTSLLDWANGILETHRIFLHVVLRGSVILPHRRVSPRRRCYLPILPRGALERVSEFLPVEKARRLRRVREFAEALTA